MQAEPATEALIRVAGGTRASAGLRGVVPLQSSWRADGSVVAGALRNPESAPRVFGNVLLCFALTEAVALFALVIAFMILFVF